MLGPALGARWAALAEAAPGGGAAVRARAALILRLNLLCVASARFLDLGLLHHDPRRKAEGGDFARDTAAADKAGTVRAAQDEAGGSEAGPPPRFTAARLLHLSRSRLLARTKALLLSQHLAASSPTLDSDMPAPALSWE